MKTVYPAEDRRRCGQSTKTWIDFVCDVGRYNALKAKKISKGSCGTDEEKVQVYGISWEFQKLGNPLTPTIPDHWFLLQQFLFPVKAGKDDKNFLKC